jgi:predicted nucleic acid-binding protein
MLSFDTNILVYAADRTAGARHIACARLLTAATSVSAALNEQSVFEFLHVSTRRRKQPLAASAQMVRAWLKNFPLMPNTTTVVEDSLTLLASYHLQVWDAHMLAVCAANGCEVLLSEDMTDGAQYGSVLVLNPFNPANTGKLADLLQP